ncbi:MAG: hypothetical protein JKY96_01960, partial [Phycisphaerales bacterium]|nr:hypothetical protein [Phycisphaerales bacterium]
PPMFQGHHQGGNPATPGFILMQLAVLSVFFTPILVSKFCSLSRDGKTWLGAAGVVGLIFGIVPASSFHIDEGRYGGWWALIAKFPAVADRSPLFVVGAVVGAVALVLWGLLLTRRDRWIFAGSFLAFTVAQSMNQVSWQRYHEPMLLVLITLILIRGVGLEQARRKILLGSVLLAGMLAAITVQKLSEESERGITDPRVESLENRLDSAILPR